MKDIIKAIAAVDLHDLLTPYAICIAIEVADRNWTDTDTSDYGETIRERIKELTDEIQAISPKK